MSCPYLDYRENANGQQFAEPRAYCTAADRFVQPMRADICNDRYDLAHDRDCEIYLEHANGSDGDTPEDGDETVSDDTTEGGDA